MMRQFIQRNWDGMVWNQIEPKFKPEDADVTLVVKQDLIGMAFHFAAEDNVDTISFTRRGEVQVVQAIRSGATSPSKITFPWDLVAGDIVELRYGIAKPVMVTALGETHTNSIGSEPQLDFAASFKAFSSLLARENWNPPQLVKQKWQPPGRVDMAMYIETPGQAAGEKGGAA